MEYLTLLGTSRPLKLPRLKLIELLDEFDNTRITKSELAEKHGISRVTLDYYLEHSKEIRHLSSVIESARKVSEGA